MEKPRLIITTDIGGDPDDQQAMIRLMCYSNEFDLEGLIASSRMEHGHDVRPDLIREIVDAYGQVRSNLLLHRSGYPAAGDLQAVVKSGQTIPGNIGEGYDTEGSDWIIACVDKADPRLLNIAIWGGATDLAQALRKVRNTRDLWEYHRFVAKIRVHTIAKQDRGVDWILEHVPDMFMVLSHNRSDAKASVFRGMYLGGEEDLTSPDWVQTNVNKNHGPLGELYPMVTYTNPNPYKCMKEGDTASWFYFLSAVQGLSDPEQPSWGSWGGRFQYAGNNLWVDAADTCEGITDSLTTVWRWRKEYQNDFAARMDWCVKPYEEANHPPTVVVKGPLTRTAAPGMVVTLDAGGSSDPDGDALSYEWMYYQEAGTYDGDLTIQNSMEPIANFTAPFVLSPTTMHIILKVTDNGTPALTSYKRVIITVDSKS